MRRSLSLILVLAGASLAAACAAPQGPPMRRGMGPPPGGPGGPGMMRGGGLFISPAGEPFRRADGGPEPLRTWFDQVDADHDGAIVWAEFEADFRRYFAVLDADHDGEIAPDEVARYESEIFPEIASRGMAGGPGMGGSGMPGGGMGRGRGGMGGGMGGGMRRGGGPGGGRMGGGGMAMMAGAARFGILPIAHPIMDADSNFNRGVSLDEFTRAAGHRFAMLDTARTGRLTLAQLAQARMQATRYRRQRAEPDDGDRPAPLPVPGD